MVAIVLVGPNDVISRLNAFDFHQMNPPTQPFDSGNL